MQPLYMRVPGYAGTFVFYIPTNEDVDGPGDYQTIFGWIPDPDPAPEEDAEAVEQDPGSASAGGQDRKPGDAPAGR